MLRRDLFKQLGILVLLSFFLLGGGMLVSDNFSEASDSSDMDAEKKRVVIELNEPSIVAEMTENDGNQQEMVKNEEVHTMKQTLQSQQQAIVNEIEQANIDIEISHEYAFTFNGLALEVHADDIMRLEDIPGVTAVYKDEAVHMNLEDSIPLIGAPEVWEREDEDGQSLTGKGVTVAIID